MLDLFLAKAKANLLGLEWVRKHKHPLKSTTKPVSIKTIEKSLLPAKNTH